LAAPVVNRRATASQSIDHAAKELLHDRRPSASARLDRRQRLESQASGLANRFPETGHVAAAGLGKVRATAAATADHR
jgi:hypothetical protein